MTDRTHDLPENIQPHVDETKHLHAACKGSYEKPRITTFGSVAELTLGGSGTKVDGSHHTRKGGA